MNLYDEPEFFKAYAEMDRSRNGLEAAGEWHQLKRLFPNVRGKHVLDLGCGYGWHCRYAMVQGATSVTGIDQSRRMIEEAMRRNPAEGITYRICSLQEFEYPENSYDLVISNLVLHYVENLETVYRKVFRTLVPGGVFLMNIEHPVFTAGRNQQFAADGTWPVVDYYHPGERQTVFLDHTVTKFHHTLTQILMGLIHSGFCIDAVEETMPPETWRAAMPEEMQRPMMLLVRAGKNSA